MQLVKQTIGMVMLAACLLTMTQVARADGPQAAWKIPLTVREYDGYGRIQTDVCNGVPLLPGQATDAAQLRLLDAEGHVIPAQFRVLARWPGASAELYHGWGAPAEDRSIRWVLVDFQASLQPFETKTYTLINGGSGPVESPLKVTQTDDVIVIDTGAAQFQINRKHFNLLDRVRIDVNGDGQYADDEEVVSPSADNGSVVEDTYGNKYSSTAGTEEVRVEEAGPVRVCVVAKGHHRPLKDGYSRGMDRFEIRMHFYANSTLVKLDPVIENNEPTSNGAPTFEDYSLLTKLNIAPAVNSNPEGDWASHGPVALYRIYGTAPIDGELRAGDTATVYQDSNGAETWDVNPGLELGGKDRPTLSTRRGYAITRHTAADNADHELAGGDHAWGVTALSGEKFGVVIVPRYFWEKFPKAVTVGQDGSVRIGILPREYAAAHWIADGGGAGMETWLYFYARSYQGKGIAYPRDTRTKSPWWNLFRDRPWPHVVANSVDPPLYALCTPEHYAATGALADAGPYMPIHSEPDFPAKVTLTRFFMTDYLKGNAYGWQSWGGRWEEMAGHSPWNYEPIATNDFAYRFINVQTIGWRDFAYPRLRQFSEVRCFRVADSPRWQFANYSSLAANSLDEEWGKRPMLNDAEAQKYSQGRYNRSEWPLPNPEHMGLDALHDAYLFFGDQRAYEGLKYPAAFGGGFMAYHVPKDPSRTNGWCLRTLVQYIQITGDPDAADYLQKTTANFWKYARTQRQLAGPWPYDNNWMYGITARAVVLAYQVTGDDRFRDLAIGMARHFPPTQGTTYHMWNDPLVTAFAWTQTGRKEFFDPKRAQEYAGVIGDNQWVYYPSCASWLWLQPRSDTTPPATVADLAAASTASGQVTLTWTAPAPGGDGDKGAASVYQVKYDDAPLAEVSDGQTTVNFWAAENVAGEPTPASAGTHESFTVKNLPAGVYYFALKSRDQQNNESEISNVVKVEIK